MSVLLHGSTNWTLIKCLEKKLDGSYTRMLHAVLNKSWKQYPIKQQLYGNLPPTSQTIQVIWASHTRHCWRSKDKNINDIFPWTPTRGHTSVGWPAKSYIHQLCAETGCRLDNLARVMADKDEEREKVKGVHDRDLMMIKKHRKKKTNNIMNFITISYNISHTKYQ